MPSSILLRFIQAHCRSKSLSETPWSARGQDGTEGHHVWGGKIGQNAVHETLHHWHRAGKTPSRMQASWVPLQQPAEPWSLNRQAAPMEGRVGGRGGAAADERRCRRRGCLNRRAGWLARGWACARARRCGAARRRGAHLGAHLGAGVKRKRVRLQAAAGLRHRHRASQPVCVPPMQTSTPDLRIRLL